MNSRVMFSAALVSIVLATAGCSKAQENADVSETSATPSAMNSSTTAVSSQPTVDGDTALQQVVTSFEERAKSGVAARNTFIKELVNAYGIDLTEAEAREIVNMANIDWNEEAAEYAMDAAEQTAKTKPEATLLDAKNRSAGFMLDMGFTQEEIDYGFENVDQRLTLRKKIDEALNQ